MATLYSWSLALLQMLKRIIVKKFRGAVSLQALELEHVKCVSQMAVQRFKMRILSFHAVRTVVSR